MKKQKLWNFVGGIHLPDMKTESSNVPIRSISLPEKLIIPLGQQYSGFEEELCVSIGDNVLRGQPLTIGQGLTLPLHASTSGTISAIIPHRIAHPSNLIKISIILIPDGKDQWMRFNPIINFSSYSSLDLLNRIYESGITGLGGAGFPTASKLNINKVDTLIINGIECEPYITADDKLMQDHADDIVMGILILEHILHPHRLFIGIADNKPAAIAALGKALCKYSNIELRIVPTKYPSGSAKQLIKILTGKEIPTGQHSKDIGIVTLNVSTVYAIKRAIINGEALTERLVTVTGKALKWPGNIWTRFGTPVNHLLAHTGFVQNAESAIIMGSAIMGFKLSSLDVPMNTITNCLLVPSIEELAIFKPEQNCIRCGNCSDVCPIQLLPQQLYLFSREREHDKARQYNLFECIECGACAYVCPSKIPLVNYFHQEKIAIRTLDKNSRRASIAKARYEAKITRLKREKQKRIAEQQQKASPTAAFLKAKVIAAISRARTRHKIAKKSINVTSQYNTLIDNSYTNKD